MACLNVLIGVRLTSIMHVLQQSMYECIPAVRNNFYKAFWTEELTALKQASIDAHNLWRLCDAPRSGLVNKIRLGNNIRIWINFGSSGILVSPIKHVSHLVLTGKQMTLPLLTTFVTALLQYTLIYMKIMLMLLPA